MPKERKKGTWLMSYADLFTLLLTAFLLSVVLINEMENTLTMTIEYLHKQGLIYLDGIEVETYIDENGNTVFLEDKNNILDLLPEIQKVWKQPEIKGALTSLLGTDF